MGLTSVLVVDDDSDIRLIAELALVDIGQLTVRTAEHGLAALLVLEEWQPDLVLIDVMMPHLSGPDTLRRMQADEKLKDIPVIFVTARSESMTDGSYLDMGALAVLTKPFDPMSLASDVSAIYDRFAAGDS